MFRFLHAADLHIDSPLLGLEQYEGAPVAAIRGATRRALENLVELALREDVSFVLIAGDRYDGDWKDYSTGLFFSRQMQRLNDAGIQVYAIAGNHDAASELTRSISLPPNVSEFSTRTVESKKAPNAPAVIHGRGFPKRAVTENLVPEYPAPHPDAFNIGLLHTSLAGDPQHDTYAPCALRDLQEKGYGYWALGHIHKPVVLSESPWIVYPGNLQGRHVRETGARGCRLVTVNDALEVTSNDFCPLDVVRWDVVTVNVGGATGDAKPGAAEAEPCTEMEELHDRIDDALRLSLSKADGRLLAVRLELTGATALHGTLHRREASLRAECISRALQLGVDRVWIEKIRLQTRPLRDLNELAEGDALTRLVLESLGAAEQQEVDRPEEVAELFRLLPDDLRTSLEAVIQGEAQQDLLNDVRAIILDALVTAGQPS